MNGQEKSVPHYLGCRGFRGEEALRVFEDTVDRLAGVEGWKRFDPGLKTRERVVNTFFDRCRTGAECEDTAQRIARDYVVLLELSDYDTSINYQLRLARNGRLSLRTQRLRFLQHVESDLRPSEMQALEWKLRLAPPAKVLKGAEWQFPRRGKDVHLVIPKGGDLTMVTAPLEDVPAATVVEPLVDDLALTDRAASIRLKVNPVHNLQGKVESWPAEDLLPLRELTTRTLTPKEWRRIAARLAYERNQFADFRFLDGKVFGIDGPVSLDLILLMR
jgi:hypothetical protein